MNRSFTLLPWAVMLTSLLFLAGCATTPQPNATLDEARDKIAELSDDTELNRLAGAELRAARDQLGAAVRAWRDGDEALEVSHKARLAMRQADIAVEAARARSADERVERLRNEREQLRLQARAARAEQAATQAELSAERARQDRSRAEADRAAEAAERMRAEQARAEAEARRREADEQRLLAEQRAAELERQSARMQAEAERLQQQLTDLEAKTTERGLVLTLGSDVLFDFDSAEVKAGARRTIERIADFLNEYSERQVLVEGFTDSTGTRDYNMGLSERRADAVRSALLDRNVDPGRIRTRGFGPDHPVASNNSEAGRQLNRRVEVIISGDEQAVPARRAD